MRILKTETTSKLFLAIFLISISCQKDYYLDDLNDALSEVDSLKSQNLTLSNQINQLNTLVNNLNVKNANIQASFDEINNAYQNSLNTIAELNQQILELTDLLIAEQALNSSISDGYYFINEISYTINDTLIWEVDEIPKRINFNLGNVVKVENSDITEDYRISSASSYWNNVSDGDVLKSRRFPSRDYTYAKEFGEKMHINEYTGDSLPYYTNFAVHDRDVFTNDLVYPKNSSGDKQVSKYVYYKLFSEEFEIIDGITHAPVVNLDQTNWNVTQYSSFDEISNVYDYSSSLNFLSDSIYNEIDQSNPKSYLSAFIKDAERYGVDLSHVNPELLEVRPWYTPTDQYGRYVTAWGSITCSETNNRIGYDNGWFEGSSLTDNRFFKLFVMYHEFGHTVLGLKHTCAKNHIMTSGSPSGNYPCNGDEINEYGPINDVDDFKRAVADLFSGYNQFYYDCYLNNSLENLNPE